MQCAHFLSLTNGEIKWMFIDSWRNTNIDQIYLHEIVENYVWHLFYFIEMNKFIWIGDKYYCFISTRYRTQDIHFSSWKLSILRYVNEKSMADLLWLILFDCLVGSVSFFLSYIFMPKHLAQIHIYDIPFNTLSLSITISFYFYFFEIYRILHFIYIALRLCCGCYT